MMGNRRLRKRLGDLSREEVALVEPAAGIEKWVYQYVLWSVLSLGSTCR